MSFKSTMRGHLRKLIVITITCFITAEAQKCDNESTTMVTQCLQPLIELAQRQPDEINNHSFPLYHFNSTGLREVCTLYSEAKKSCLMPKKLDEICKSEGLITIFETLFGYPCDPSNEARFFRHFGCAASVLVAESECDDSIRVPSVPTAGWNKCAAIPEFYLCLGPKVREKCGQTAQEILHDSIVAYGCTNVDDAKPAGDDIRRRPVSDGSPPEQDSKDKSTTSTNSTTQGTTKPQTKAPEKSNMTTTKPTTAAAEPKTTATTAKAESEKSTEKSMMAVNSSMENEMDEKMSDKTSKPCQYRSNPKLKECFDTSKLLYDSFSKKFTDAKKSGEATFPLFAFSKKEFLAFCADHASVFLNCRQNVYQKCRDDMEVKIADILLSYGCGQPTAFFKALECVGKVQEADSSCIPELKLGTDMISCMGKTKFSKCLSKLAASDAACTEPHNGKTPVKFLLAAIDYYKCSS